MFINVLQFERGMCCVLNKAKVYHSDLHFNAHSICATISLYISFSGAYQSPLWGPVHATFWYFESKTLLIKTFVDKENW